MRTHNSINVKLPLAFAFVWTVMASPQAAWAIPIFANGQGGVSCEQCHNAPPNLNAYGRYVMATNFSRGLDPHSQMRENLRDPVSFAGQVNGSNVQNPLLPKTYVSLINTLAGGFFGPQVTYDVSAPVVAGGFAATKIDQIWGAYNGFASGNGSLQVGKFPTPVFAPWLAGSLSLTGYGLGGIPVGLNSSTVGDNRWGATYSQIGRTGLVGTAGFITSSGSIEHPFDGGSAYGSDVNYGGEGSSFVGSLQFLNPSSHFTGGIAALNGTYPLPSGAKDAYSREMALVSYSTSPKFTVDAMALMGHDNNPNDDGTGSAGSNGMSYEAIYNPLDWLHFNARYEHTNDGLSNLHNNYIGAVAFSILPNLVLTFDNLSSVGNRPVMSYQLMWAGPYFRHASNRRGVVAAASPSAAPLAATGATKAATVAVAPASGTPGAAASTASAPARASTSSAPAGASASAAPAASAPAASAPAASAPAAGAQAAASASSEATPSAVALKAGEHVYATNCIACHGAQGQGGMGPKLGALAARKSMAETISFIESPAGNMPKLYPGQISADQVHEVAAYIRATFH